MYHERCSYIGCDKRFSKPTRGGVEQALRMHVARKHTQTIITPTKASGKWRGKYPPREESQTISPLLEQTQISTKTGLPKRVYTKRKPQPQIETQSINYCPNCGCPVGSVALAMAAAKMMNGK